MCGIFGYVGRDLPPVRDLARITNLLSHRGPDAGACWHEPGVFLGHRRLSIIDLAAGAQPMFSADGRYVITFNGEIYNYPELRDQLRGLGAVFDTASDTEVILAGYAHWGTGVAARLEGMFAFLVYDRLERTAFLARDRFGEKPLLVAHPDGGLAFASELAPLVALGVGGRELDHDALGAYLCLNYVPGTRTMLRAISRVAPAEWRLYGSEGLRRRERYWSPPAAPRDSASRTPARPAGDLLDELQQHVDGAVRLTLRSDVPVGLFLSGGVDSSLVAQSAVRLGRLERAYCVDFPGTHSEWQAASRVATQVGVDLTRVPLDASTLNEFVDVTRHLDDPLADSSALAVWNVARAAGRDLKVVLSGDGGDELFGGYLTYAASAWHQRLRPLLPGRAWGALASVSSRLPVDDRGKVSRGYKLHRFLRGMPLPTREAHFTWNGTWLPSQAAALATDERLRQSARHALRDLVPASAGAATIHDLQIVDVREYLANDILAKVDRATMAHGLESRAPLLNTAVAEFALGLPLEWRVKGTVTKVLLRELCARHFGHAHAYAPKQGFSIPVHTWLRHQGRPLMTGLLARDRVDAIGWLDSAAVSRVVERHLAGAALGWELWGLMVLVAWFEERVARRPAFDHLPEVPAVAAPACPALS
jgi:asparagine synthase (glutamine-hydrolysing)